MRGTRVGTVRAQAALPAFGAGGRNTPGRLRACLAALLLIPAAAGAGEAPRVEVVLDPEGPVTVGTPLEVTATVLVPSYMPKPPVWPDLGIADAVTRLPGRATQPVTRRVGSETWSGLARTWEIIPQRAADYALAPAEITVTYADPDTSQPVEETVALPDIAFSARLPPGAEGMDPFIPATALTITARVEGLPDAPKPGDAFTLTLTTTASGPPAIFLPPLAAGGGVPGLRAYPKEPVLADTPGERGGSPVATRVETATYVIERPGNFEIPGVSLDWWNTAASTRETARADPVSLTVPAPKGWRAAAEAARDHRPALLLGLALLAGAGLLGWLAARGHPASGAPPPPSEASLYRAARAAARAGTPAAARCAVTAWLARVAPDGTPPAIEAALRELDRPAYGAATDPAEPRAARTALLDALGAARDARPGTRRAPPALPALNPAPFAPEIRSPSP